MVLILVATTEEFNLARKYFSDSNYSIVKTGVGASNVIRTCSAIAASAKEYKNRKIGLLNIGFCGSNILPKGEVVRISKSFRLVDDNVSFADYRNPYILSKEGVPCYTSNSFVTTSDMDEPKVFDMELNYIVAFDNLKHIGAIKIVSDNLSVEEYENTVALDNPDIWWKVRKLVDRIHNDVYM